MFTSGQRKEEAKRKRKGKQGKCIYQPLSITFSLKVDCLQFRFSLHFKGFLWKAKCLIIFLFLGFEWQAKSLKCAGSASRLTYQWQPTSYKGFLCFLGDPDLIWKVSYQWENQLPTKAFYAFKDNIKHNLQRDKKDKDKDKKTKSNLSVTTNFPLFFGRV